MNLTFYHNFARYISILVIILLAAIPGMSQSAVYGTIKGTSGEGIPGVSVNGDKQLGVGYLGNNKALLISAHDAETNVKEWNDWWYAAMWEYLVVDVSTQKVVRKLDLPPVLNSRSAVIHEGKAYIAVNDPNADAIYVWEYDGEKDTFKRGLKVEGGSNNTPTLFKLN